MALAIQAHCAPTHPHRCVIVSPKLIDVRQSTCAVAGAVSGASDELSSIQFISVVPPFRAAFTWLVTSKVKTKPPVPLGDGVTLTACPVGNDPAGGITSNEPVPDTAGSVPVAAGPNRSNVPAPAVIAGHPGVPIPDGIAADFTVRVAVCTNPFKLLTEAMLKVPKARYTSFRDSPQLSVVFRHV